MSQRNNLKTKLIAWRDRFYSSNLANIDNNYKFFLNKLISDGPILEILMTAVNNYPLDEKDRERYSEAFLNEEFIDYKSEEHIASVIFQVLLDLEQKGNNAQHLLYRLGVGGTFDQNFRNWKANFLDQILNYVLDQLEESNFVLYLLEKYKSRTELFMHKDLIKKYKEADSNYEQILDDDLRLYLFDQGIEHPFSTPKTSSGRTDIVGLLDTSTPLILEIKVYDHEKTYKKNRIISGFSQVVKYSNDYNKNSAYLIIFNVENIEIQISTSKENNMFPPVVHFNNKSFYIIIINLNFDISASKLGKLQVETITEEELIESVKVS